MFLVPSVESFALPSPAFRSACLNFIEEPVTSAAFGVFSLLD